MLLVKDEYENYYKNRDRKLGRVILHSDLNNFFASVETLFDESLKEVPLAICGDVEKRHGIILAKNEKAKKFGIKTGEAVWEAKAKCPGITLRPCRYRDYVKYSRDARNIYLRYTPCIEPFGIDEAWLDITELAARENRSDPFSAGVEIADRIRNTVKNEIGLTVSIGVSFNKSFAKLASDMKKPDAVTPISPDGYREKIRTLPASDLLFVGKKATEKLKRMNICTVEDIVKTGRYTLRELIGKNGELLFDTADGYDVSEVAFYGKADDPKSISNSTTTPFNITNYSEAITVLLSVSEAVSARLRNLKMLCNIVRIYIRNDNLKVITRQRKLPIPIYLSEDIFKIAFEMFRENVNFESPVRGVGIALDGIFNDTGRQITIYDMSNKKDFCKIENALDNIRYKYGVDSIKRGVGIEHPELWTFDREHPAFTHNI